MKMSNNNIFGLSDIQIKDDLKKFTKEQLIDMFWSTLENNRGIIEFIVNGTDEQLLDYQRQWKWMKKFIEDGCQLTEDNCCCYENIKNKYEFDEKGNIIGYKVNL